MASLDRYEKVLNDLSRISLAKFLHLNYFVKERNGLFTIVGDEEPSLLVFIQLPELVKAEVLDQFKPIELILEVSLMLLRHFVFVNDPYFLDLVVEVSVLAFAYLAMPADPVRILVSDGIAFHEPLPLLGNILDHICLADSINIV